MFRGVGWNRAAFSTVQFYWDVTPGLSVCGYRCFGGALLSPVLQLSSGLIKLEGRSVVGTVCQLNEQQTGMFVNTVVANSNLAPEQQNLDAGGAVTRHEYRNSSRNVVYSNYRPHAAQNPAYVPVTRVATCDRN